MHSKVTKPPATQNSSKMSLGNPGTKPNSQHAQSGADKKQGLIKESFKKVRLSDSNLRNWLNKHGKDKYIDFNNEERKQYKEVFDALDNDGSKAISIKELEDPLIALGFVANRDKVKEMVDEVDEDGSGKIEFDEFLLIMRSIKKNSQNDKGGSSSLYDFFQGLMNGNLDKMGDMEKELPFTLKFSLYRRRRIMDAIMSDDEVKRKEGQKIMNVR